MLNRRDFVKMALLGATQFTFNGCVIPLSPIRLAAQSWPGYEMFFVADQSGALDHSLVNVIETHSASVSMRLLGAGAVESACLTMDEVFTCYDRGIELVVIAVLDFSHGADVVLAKPDIKRFSDVKGKTIGVESTATGAVMLNNFLQAAKLLPSDLNIKFYTVDEHEAAYASGAVDVLVTYEPVKSRLEKAGMVSIYDSSMNPNQIFDVLALSRSALHSHEKQVQHLLETHFNLRQTFFENPSAILQLMSNRMKMPQDKIVDIYQGLSMPDIAENRKLIGGSNPELKAHIQALANTMVSSNLLTRTPDIEQILAPQFLNAISG